MHVRHLHSWHGTVAEAEAIQDELRQLVDLTDPGPTLVEYVAGLDVAYAPSGDALTAAVVVMQSNTFDTVEQVVVVQEASFPYIPGLFAFRELPPLINALEKVKTSPNLLLCDAHGLAHPRRFGLASHLGVLTDLPTIGVAKNILGGSCEMPPRERGSWTPINDGGQVIGRALRTRTGVKPVYVSTGHRISLENACRHVLALARKYRIPEPIRRADQLSRRVPLTAKGSSGDMPDG
jgi:deoxyribonuclease V